MARDRTQTFGNRMAHTSFEAAVDRRLGAGGKHRATLGL